ncbi:hypothetical protein CHS0354_016428 [Potamilus streckersoni]|uniref:C1q domain-containing protein n=1 Tax=Potamilus streckersoni TaxID=2493646 RepID=A0AAE0SUI7_9BIVA|nr:hypothetical protein CHS0354_016428 [Potamilus streckersoni]
MGKTLEELMKRMWMLEEKLRSYDKKIVQIKQLEEKLKAAEEVTNKQFYRINLLEKMLHKSDHTQRVQNMFLKRKMKEEDRRLMHVEAFENRFRTHLEHLYHQSMINRVNLNEDHRIDAAQVSVDVVNDLPNYKEIRNVVDSLTRVQLSSDYISKAIRTVPRMRIGFSAVQDRHGESVRVGQSIIFHNVIFNEAGAFDTSTGIFRCPVSGAYFITFTVCSYQGRRIFASLIVDGNQKFEVFGGVGTENNDTYDSTGTGSAIIQCQAGGQIWAKVTNGDAVGRHTFFTGYLLWEDSISS